MLHHLSWQRLDNPTVEHATVSEGEAGMLHIQSSIRGRYEGAEVDLDYTLVLRPDWSWSRLDIQNRCGPSLALQRGGAGLPDTLLIDFFLTPITNALPIRRLGLQTGERQELDTIYLHLETLAPSTERQSYERLTENTYRFASEDDSGFTAIIEVDADGWVTAYGGLFARVPS